MDDVSPLVAELRKPEYANMSHQEAAEAINAKTAIVKIPVPAATVQEITSGSGMWGQLRIAAEDSNLSSQPRCAAIAFIDWVTSGRAIDTDKPAIQQLASTLVSAGLVTTDQIQQINAAASVTVPWAQANGLPEIGIGLVINARKSISR